MKKFIKISALLLILIGSFISCKKDDDEPKNDLPLNKSTISAKWVVSDASSPYASFEFNQSGNYIVANRSALRSAKTSVLVKRTAFRSAESPEAEFGTYVIIDENTIILTGFGTLKIKYNTDNTISFTLILDSNPGVQMPIIATKAAEMPSTTKTDYLCKTWQIYTLNGLDVVGTEDEGTVLFSRAGTYYITYAIDNTDALSYWRWKDNTQNILEYSWPGTFTPDDTGEVTIQQLSSDILVIEESYYDYITDLTATDVYVLTPVVN